MKRYLLVVSLMMITWAVSAQTLTANAPSQVQNGENFRLTYTVNTSNASDFRIGEIPEALEIITGPYTSEQSNFQMVNGHTSSSSSITYTYILCANKNGSFTIPAARVHANGKTITSNPLKVTVSGKAAGTGNAPKMHDDYDDRPQMRAAGTPISGSDLFIKVSANKQRVHEQEPILLTYKVYTLVDLTQLEGKMPDLTGFHSQEVKMPQQKSFHIESVNGRNYRCVTWSQYVMYPQMTGDLEIPSITFNGTVIQQNRNVDPFEAFLNGGSGYVEVKRSIKAPGLKIHVDPLPKRPDKFSGGVGKFNISGQLNKTEVKANDPITVRVVVGGVGNLKLIKQPVVNFPKDFDKYDPKVTDKTKLTANGVEGNMIYDFLAVPRNQGKYTIPPVEFTYYDVAANAYKTIKTQAFELEVDKGDGNGGTAVDFTDEKNQDIHAIKTGKVVRKDAASLFFGSASYWIVLALLLAAFIALMIIFRRRAIENADIVKMRGKKANKVANKRLRAAHKLMVAGKQGEFYDEVLRALWGYMGDKLNIPVSELSHDNIADKLAEHHVDEQTVNSFIEALDECEFERYAPGDAAGNMNKTYESAATAIEKIEEVMKKKNTRTRGTLVLLTLLFLFPTTIQAVTKQDADAEYSKGNYQQAIKDYEELLKAGESAEIYYNLGNAYYRTEMARSKTIDKITPESEMFFFTWYRSLVNLMTIDGWAHLAIASIILTLILALVYLFAGHLTLRKIGFYGGVLFLIIFLLSNLFAFQQKQMLMKRNGAIVTAPSVTIKKTPVANSADQGVIHEGTRVDIIDDTMRDWKEIHLADGREGWIPATQIEKI